MWEQLFSLLFFCNLANQKKAFYISYFNTREIGKRYIYVLNTVYDRYNSRILFSGIHFFSITLLVWGGGGPTVKQLWGSCGHN